MGATEDRLWRRDRLSAAGTLRRCPRVATNVQEGEESKPPSGSLLIPSFYTPRDTRQSRSWPPRIGRPDSTPFEAQTVLWGKRPGTLVADSVGEASDETPAVAAWAPGRTDGDHGPDSASHGSCTGLGARDAAVRAPAVGGAVSKSPQTLTLTFDSPVALPRDPVRLTGLQGPVDALGASTLEDASRTVRVGITDRVEPGLYTVTWQVISDDGEAVTGSYHFGVGSAANLSRSDFSPPNTAGAPASAFLHWVSFVALAWVGGAWMLCFLVRKSGPYRPRKGLTFLACLLGAASAVGLRTIAVGAGDLGSGLQDLSVSTLTNGPGLVSLLEVASFVAAGALALGRRREWLVLPVALIVAAEAVRAHPRAADPVLGGAVTSVHLGALVLWVGTLV
ncbi:MAG: copper resistance protein CopC, partial [Gemmatimonadota bacterium]|nr:copper resistance protein CopC [Gemmatimonadota bacterium]